MPIEVIKTDLAEVLLIKPRVFVDERGFFFEAFNQKEWLDATGIDCNFVQDNHSRSAKGVLRGLHYQLPPYAQAKLVRVVAGEVYDVAVDLRKSSATFGKWTGQILSAENKLQMWIPEGFAHGFLVLSDFAEVIYKTTNYYAIGSERSVHWNDSQLDIAWPFKVGLSLSGKDDTAVPLCRAECFSAG